MTLVHVFYGMAVIIALTWIATAIYFHFEERRS